MNINISEKSIYVIKGFINGTLRGRIKNIAISTGFIKRNDGKLLPETFVNAFTFGMLHIKVPTLKNMAAICETMQEGLEITREAIHQRLEAGAELLKEVLKETLAYSVNTVINACTAEVLNKFSNVYIADSTIVILPKRLAKIAKGTGGKGQKGSLCIQHLFSLLNRCFTNIETFLGSNNDRAYTAKLVNMLQKGSLIIFDRGYRSYIAYKEITEKGAFFLTRLITNSVFYSTKTNCKYPSKELDISSILKKSNGTVDMEVLLGANPDSRTKCRLVAVKLSEKDANENVRLARVKRRKNDLPRKELELLRWKIFITNAPKEKLSIADIYNLYKLRWQIEIVFKACKSHLGLADVGIGGKGQMDCVIYGKLIMEVLMATMYSKYYAALYVNQHKELSILKFFSNIKCYAIDIIQLLKQKSFNIKGFMELFCKISKNSLHQIGKKKTSLEELEEAFLPKLE
jgi:hypothetical protein